MHRAGLGGIGGFAVTGAGCPRHSAKGHREEEGNR